jgi:hypothetical protein
MSDRSPTGGYYLPPHDPLFPRWAAAVQLEPDLRVHQMSGLLVANCPLAYRGDPAQCADYLAGANTAAVVQAAVAAAENDAAKVNLPRAEAAKDGLIRANRDLEAINADRAKIATTPVVGPHGRLVTPAENRKQLAQTKRVVHQRELIDDDEHTKVAHTPVSGHIAAVVSALTEVVFTMRVFNVSLTHLVLLSFVPWLAVTVGLALFNVKVGEWLGRKRRAARETERAAEAIPERHLARAHAGGAL